MGFYFLFRTLRENGTTLSKMKYYFTIILFEIIFVLDLILGFRSPPEEQGDEIAGQEPA